MQLLRQHDLAIGNGQGVGSVQIREFCQGVRIQAAGGRDDDHRAGVHIEVGVFLHLHHSAVETGDHVAAVQSAGIQVELAVAHPNHAALGRSDGVAPCSGVQPTSISPNTATNRTTVLRMPISKAFLPFSDFP